MTVKKKSVKKSAHKHVVKKKPAAAQAHKATHAAKAIHARKAATAPVVESTKDYSKVVLYPSMTEKVVRSGDQNKVGFIVSRSSDKHSIRDAVEALYGVKVVSVNTQILPDGRKRAYVRLTSEHNATELATKLGML